MNDCSKESGGPRAAKKSKTLDRLQSHPERVEMRRWCQRSEIPGILLTDFGSFPVTQETLVDPSLPSGRMSFIEPIRLTNGPISR